MCIDQVELIPARAARVTRPKTHGSPVFITFARGSMVSGTDLTNALQTTGVCNFIPAVSEM